MKDGIFEKHEIRTEIRKHVRERLEEIGHLTTRRTGHGESCQSLVFDDYNGDGGAIEKLVDYCESLYFPIKQLIE